MTAFHVHARPRYVQTAQAAHAAFSVNITYYAISLLRAMQEFIMTMLLRGLPRRATHLAAPYIAFWPPPARVAPPTSRFADVAWIFDIAASYKVAYY